MRDARSASGSALGPVRGTQPWCYRIAPLPRGRRAGEEHGGGARRAAVRPGRRNVRPSTSAQRSASRLVTKLRSKILRLHTTCGPAPRALSEGGPAAAQRAPSGNWSRMDRPPRARAETWPTCVLFPTPQSGSFETSVSGNPDSGRSRSAYPLRSLLLASLSSTSDPTPPTLRPRARHPGATTPVPGWRGRSRQPRQPDLAGPRGTRDAPRRLTGECGDNRAGSRRGAARPRAPPLATSSCGRG